MSRRRRGLRSTALVGVLVVAAACGADETGPLPTLTADEDDRAVVVEAPSDEPATDGRASGAAADEESPLPTVEGPATAGEEPDDAGTPVAEADDEESGARPPAGAIAALVDEQLATVGAAQHVVADLDGDEVVEVVLAGIADGRASVTVWWWEDGSGFGGPVTQDAGPGRTIEELRAGDVTDDGETELLVRVRDGARDALAVFTVLEEQRLLPRRAIGGCFAGTHVYGATSAVLQARSDGPPAIVATCDDSPLPVADWTSDVYEFRDGAYRFVAGGGPDGPAIAGDGDPDDDGPGDDGSRGTPADGDD